MGFHHLGKVEDKKLSRLLARMNTIRQISSRLWAVVLVYEVLDLYDKVKLDGFLGHLHPQCEYRYYKMGLKNESAPTSEVYEDSNEKRHLFKKEQGYLLHLSREHDAKADKLIFATSDLAR
jgi:hypothetical protein